MPSGRVSSFVGDPERQCHGKVRYSSKAKAKRGAKRARTRHGKTEPGQLWAYHCPHCGGYHNGRYGPR